MVQPHRVFRDKLIFPEQRSLYNYWLSKTDSKGIPARKDIHPKDFLYLLPTVSLIDVKLGKVCSEEERYQVRLAGTHLSNIYQTEITGLPFGALPLGNKRLYWKRVYNWVTENSLPATGVVKLSPSQENTFIQFWLHLPLSGNGRDVNMILCYDVFLSVEEAALKLQKENYLEH